MKFFENARKQYLDEIQKELSEYKEILRNLQNFRYVVNTDFFVVERKKAKILKKIGKLEKKSQKLYAKLQNSEWPD